MSSEQTIARGLSTRSSLRDAIQKTSSTKMYMTKDYKDASGTQATGGAATCYLIEKYARLIAKSLKQTSTSVPVLAILNDRQENDWAITKKEVEEGLSVELQNGRIKIETKPGSMYKMSVAPSSSVHMGFTNYAIQWLSQTPVQFSDALWANNLPGGMSNPDRMAIAHQSREDLTSFLKLRAEEIMPQGYLVLGIPGCEDGTTQAPLYTAMENAFQYLVANGDINDVIAKKLVVGEYIRTLSECLEPLESEPLSKLWTVVLKQSSKVSCPFKQALNQGDMSLKDCIDNQVNVGKAFADWVISAELTAAASGKFWEHIVSEGLKDQTGHYSCTDHIVIRIVLQRKRQPTCSNVCVSQ